MEHKTRVRVSNATRDIASSVNNNVCTRDDGRKRWSWWWCCRKGKVSYSTNQGVCVGRSRGREVTRVIEGQDRPDQAQRLPRLKATASTVAKLVTRQKGREGESRESHAHGPGKGRVAALASSSSSGKSASAAAAAVAAGNLHVTPASGSTWPEKGGVAAATATRGLGNGLQPINTGCAAPTGPSLLRNDRRHGWAFDVVWVS